MAAPETTQQENIIKELLNPNEAIQWTGKPNPLAKTLPHTFIFVFSVIWLTSSLFFLLASFGLFTNDGFQWRVFLFFTPFTLFGLGLISVPIYAYIKAKRTIYAITDQRAIIYTPQKTKSFYGNQILEVRTEKHTFSGFNITFGKGKRVYSNNSTYIKYDGFYGFKEPHRLEAMLNALIATAPPEPTLQDTPKPGFARRNLTHPPRHIPWTSKIWLYFNPNNWANLLGWIFIIIGMPLVWKYTLNSDLSILYNFNSKSVTTQGIVVECYATNFEFGNSGTTYGTPTYAIEFKSITEDGTEFTGTSYATGLILGKGKQVTVQFPQGKPHLARIEGTRRKPVGLIGLIPMITVIVGAGMVLSGLIKGFKRKGLLRNGRFTSGVLIDKTKTSMAVNREPVYKLTFEYETKSSKHQLTVKTHKVDKFTDLYETIIYNPANPQKACLVENLPGKLKFDPDGNIIPRPSALPIITVIVISTVIIGNLTYAIIKFTG